ncbi:MAG: OpgC domain-containing protein [Pseudomonadota bacterium]
MRGEASAAEDPAGNGGRKSAGEDDPRIARLAKEKRRDIRLDFFRGLGMFIILIAHTPWNSWNRWIPARWGYSDATEIFVFCSGAASAIAFLKLFEARGWGVGTARVAYRIWQLYWCHIGVFFATLAALMVVDQTLVDAHRNYVGVLNLSRFVNDPAAFLPSLFTLTYVPNYFDILVMYMVILALMPVMVALSWIRPWVALTFSALLWAASSQPWIAFIDVPAIEFFSLPAEPVGNPRGWFFNPFAWQLIFFTGFAFAVGWLPKPPANPWLIGVAIFIVLICPALDPDGVPIRRLVRQIDWLYEPIKAFNDATGALHSKSFFGIFRYVHFLALAYLVWLAAGEGGRRLPQTGIGGRVVTVVRRVGQQSLAVFIASLLLARLLGVGMLELGLLNPEGRWPQISLPVTIAVNLTGFALIIGVAYIARYFRNPPWKT